MSKNDFSMYSSNDGMNTKVWGPHLWNFLFRDSKHDSGVYGAE
jgi:hypothetical protein